MTSWLINDRYSTSLLIIYIQRKKLNKSFRCDRKNDGTSIVPQQSNTFLAVPALNFCVTTSL
jgi:hypothetical protein